MTELEQKIIKHVEFNQHRLYYQDKIQFNRISRYAEDIELNEDDRWYVENWGKAFGLMPLTAAEAASERRNRMKRHPGPGPLKTTSRRRRRRF